MLFFFYHYHFSHPPSRQGYADPPSFSHYQNQAEIQAQLNRHDYYQSLYHTQQQQQKSSTPLPPYTPTPHPRFSAPHHPIQAPAPRLPPQHPQDYGSHDNSTVYAQPWAHHPQSRPQPQQNYSHRGGGGGADPPPPRKPGHKGRILPTPPTQGSPPRPRSQTPINQLGYLSHANSRPPMGPMTSGSHPSHHQRPHSAYITRDYDDPRQAYTGQTNYGSLPRRYNSNHRDQIIVSGSAQV